MSFRASLQNIIRPLVENRLLLSLGISAASGIVLHGMFPLNTANPFLRLIELERPPIFHAHGAMTYFCIRPHSSSAP